MTRIRADNKNEVISHIRIHLRNPRFTFCLVAAGGNSQMNIRPHRPRVGGEMILHYNQEYATNAARETRSPVGSRLNDLVIL